MAALTQGRKHPDALGRTNDYPIAATTTIYAGGLVALNSSGYLVPMSASATLIAVGVADTYNGHDRWDNSAGAAAALYVKVKEGVYRFNNSAAGDLIASTEVGKVCYGVDDQTVAKTSNSGARSPAGIVFRVDSTGVWVAVGPTFTKLANTTASVYTQTYSTANRTVANPTATAPAAATFAAIVTLTDNSGYTGTHDDTLAATTLPASLTDNSGGVSGGDTIAAITTGGNVGADVPNAIATLAAKVAAYRTMLNVALQNISDVTAKVIEVKTQLDALAADRAADVTQITALVADDLDNRQSIGAIIDDMQSAAIVG